MPEITPGYGVNLRLDGENLIAEKELPDKIEITLEDVTISESGEYDTSVIIPYNRCYGVFVGTSGLLEPQSVMVEFSDNSPNGNLKYSAEFTDELPEDTSQAWYYRDSMQENNMNIHIENTGTGSVTVTLNIVMEPF